MTIRIIESSWKQNFGQLLYPLNTDTKIQARKLEKNDLKIKSIVFNQKYLNDTNIHALYIYIYM